VAGGPWSAATGLRLPIRQAQGRQGCDTRHGTRNGEQGDRAARCNDHVYGSDIQVRSVRRQQQDSSPPCARGCLCGCLRGFGMTTTATTTRGPRAARLNGSGDEDTVPLRLCSGQGAEARAGKRGDGYTQLIRVLTELCVEGRYLRRTWFPVAGQHGRKQRGHGTQQRHPGRLGMPETARFLTPVCAWLPLWLPEGFGMTTTATATTAATDTLADVSGSFVSVVRTARQGCYG
jgi:hypothetical protein